MAGETQRSGSKAQPQQSSTQQPAAQPSTGQRDAFVKHLEHASGVVQTWPTWKQQVLGGAAAQAAPSKVR